LSPAGPAAVAVPDRTSDGLPLLPGASVILELDDGELLSSVMRAFLPPLAGLIGGPLLARSMLSADETGALVAAVAGLAAGCAAARALHERRPARVAVRLSTEFHGT
jgi:positive regulator of sigma E activity